MKKLIVGISALALVAAGTQAGVIVSEDFDSYSNFVETPDGLNPNATWGTGTVPAWGGGNTFTSSDGDAPGISWVGAQAGSGFEGNWNGGMPGSGGGIVKTISSWFYSNSGSPSDKPNALEMYFVGTGEYWYYSLAPVGGWTYYTVNVGQSYVGAGQWYNLNGRNSAQFLTDLGNVTEVGYYLTYEPGYNDQVYAMDSLTLLDDYNVPEPGTMMFLGAAFVSLGLTFRRRLGEGLAMVKTAIKG